MQRGGGGPRRAGCSQALLARRPWCFSSTPPHLVSRPTPPRLYLHTFPRLPPSSPPSPPSPFCSQALFALGVYHLYLPLVPLCHPRNRGAYFSISYPRLGGRARGREGARGQEGDGRVPASRALELRADVSIRCAQGVCSEGRSCPLERLIHDGNFKISRVDAGCAPHALLRRCCAVVVPGLALLCTWRRRSFVIQT